MSRSLAALFMVASCGHYDFARVGGASGGADAALDGALPDTTGVCAPVGHDEDADGIDDACDLCPQRTDSGLDADGDGVGDTCDLATTVQERVLFDPFTGPLPAWDYGTGTFAGDSYALGGANTGTTMRLTDPVGSHDTFEVAGRVTALGATPHQVSITLRGPESVYECSVADESDPPQLFVVYGDGARITSLGAVPIDTINSVFSGAFRLILDHGPSRSRCILELDGTRFEVPVTLSNPIELTTAAIDVFRLDVELTSFVRLHTP